MPPRVRPANRNLDPGDVRSILRTLKAGSTVRACARTHQCDPKTVRNVRDAAPATTTRPKARRTSPTIRRRRKKAAALAVKTVRAHGKRLRREFPTCVIIAHAIGVSPSTVRRDLHAEGFVSRARPKRPCMDESDFQKRLVFAQRMLHSHTSAQLRSIAFSDEKLFDTNDHGHSREWVARGQKPTPREFAKWAPKVMVWGVIAVNFKALYFFPRGEQVDAAAYQKAIARTLPSIRKRNLIFQQDGARCHTAKTTLNLIKSKGVTLLEGFPARSPDLNPIENMWALVQRAVPAHLHGDLEEAVRSAWNAIPQSVVNNLVSSFAARLVSVEQQNGRFTQ